MRDGFVVDVVPPVRMDGAIVSSTAHPQSSSRGDVESAATALAGLTASGGVWSTAQAWSALGFPTINSRSRKSASFPARRDLRDVGRDGGGTFQSGSITRRRRLSVVGNEYSSLSSQTTPGSCTAEDVEVAFVKRFARRDRLSRSPRSSRTDRA